MRIGDALEWKGVNKDHYGIITQSEQGDLVVRMADGSSLPLEALLGSRHIKVWASSKDLLTTTTSGCMEDATYVQDAER